MILALLLLAPATEAPRPAPPVVRTIYVSNRPTPLEALARGAVRLLPTEAVHKAADAAPGPVSAVFDLTVRATGTDDGNFHLNSEADYRDQRNLTVTIPAARLKAIQQVFGTDLDAYFKGRRILIVGQARRIRINFTNAGRPTGKYYYQTHVLLHDPRQVQRLD